MNEQPTCVALVSGGAKGIGAAIAARLSRDGWRVVIADRAPSGAAPFGGRYVECDVADEEAVHTD
jgi:NAD(P)-dependent dehydrogenase (short-subunit alcohol dehydrogenase family)